MVGRTMAFVGHADEIGPVVRACGANVRFVASSEGVAGTIRALGLDCRALDDYGNPAGREEMRKACVEWLEDWSNRVVDGSGASFKEEVVYRGVSLWWFILPVIFPDVLRCMQYVAGFRTVLEREMPEEVGLLDVKGRRRHPFRLNYDENLPSFLVGALCEACGAKVRYVRGSLSSGLRWWAVTARARLLKGVYYRIGRWFMGWLRQLLVGAPGTADAGNPTIAVLSSPVYWRDGLSAEGTPVRNDAIAGTTITLLHERGYRLLGLDTELNVPSFQRLAVLREKRRRRDIDWNAIESYARRVPSRRKRERRCAVRELWARVRGRLGERRPLSYGGVELWPVLASRFDFIFTEYLDECLGYLEAIEQFCRQESPELFLLVYEEGAYGRAATIVGHWLGLPSVALQHGILSSPHIPNYYFAAVTNDVREDGISCPIPTRTLVYGEQTREMLTQVSAYPEDRVAVVGMPSYDPVIQALPRLSKARELEALGLAPDKPVILVASQPFLNREHRYFFADAVLAVAARMPESQWVVKLHPSEAPTAWDRHFEEHRITGIQMFTSDLHRLLFVCDAVVSWFSTTILEACLFEKPVVAVRIPGCYAPEDYIEDGLVHGVGGAEELQTRLAELIASTGADGQRAAEAVVRYTYLPDGRSTERVADAIAELVATAPRPEVSA